MYVCMFVCMYTHTQHTHTHTHTHTLPPPCGVPAAMGARVHINTPPELAVLNDDIVTLPPAPCQPPPGPRGWADPCTCVPPV